MNIPAKHAATTPIPVQLSETEFTAFIFPHLSMPKRGPKYKLDYHCVFNLILWVLYTGMQWKCLPIPKDPQGKPALHYTNVYRVFAKWTDDGSLQKAFMASVADLSEAKKLDLRVLHGDGTNTVAKKGAMGVDTLGTSTRRGEKVIAITDNHGYVLSPLPVAPVNKTDNEAVTLTKEPATACETLLGVAKTRGGYDNRTVGVLRVKAAATAACPEDFHLQCATDRPMSNVAKERLQ